MLFAFFNAASKRSLTTALIVPLVSLIFSMASWASSLGVACPVRTRFAIAIPSSGVRFGEAFVRLVVLVEMEAAIAVGIVALIATAEPAMPMFFIKSRLFIKYSSKI